MNLMENKSLTADNSLLDDQLVNESNGTYRFDRSVILFVSIAAGVGTVFFGMLAMAVNRRESLRWELSISFFILSLGCVFVLVNFRRLSGRTLNIGTDSISLQDNHRNEIGSLRWIELARVSERRKMAQIALWDKSGSRRILIDQQFENFSLIRSRILGEYAKVFILKSLPTELRRSNPLLYESFVFPISAIVFGWLSWMAYRQGQEGVSIALLSLVGLASLSSLKLYPQLGGRSVVFEDRIVLRSLFREEELYKKNIASIEIGDQANPMSRTNFSLILLKATNGKRMKITALYGDMLEIYVTLQAWMAHQK